MSVDISRLAAHLAPEQQRAIAKEYRRRAEHDTTAFLLCFFAGILGAHRFYLRQFGSGLLHLVLPVVAVVIVIGGLALDVKPATLAIVAIPLLLIGLVWAIIDLFRIDDQVYQRNLKLAEDLIARAMLADPSVERQARATLERVEHDAATATSGAAGTAALASRQPETEAEYRATTVTQVSESVPGQAQLGGSPETTEQTESVPIAGYGPQVQETVTARHEQTPTSVTDSVETIKTYEPALPSAAASASAEPVAAAQAEPDDTMPAASAPDASAAPPVWEAPAVTAAPPTWEVPTESNEAAAATWPSPHLPASGNAPAPPARKLDVTDLGGDVTEAPVADVGMENTAPQRVVLPEDLARATASGHPSAPASASGGAQTHPYGDPSASVADDALLFLVPEAATQAAEPAPEPAPAPTWDAPTQHSAPPVALQDDAATAPAGPPVWPTPGAPSAPESATEQADDQTQSLPLAGMAAVGAGMGAAELAGERNAQPPAPSAPPAPHKLRRVRVTRQIVIDGKVVEETSAEELIEPDADAEPVRARLQEELHRKADARERELRGQG